MLVCAHQAIASVCGVTASWFNDVLFCATRLEVDHGSNAVTCVSDFGRALFTLRRMQRFAAALRQWLFTVPDTMEVGWFAPACVALPAVSCERLCPAGG